MSFVGDDRERDRLESMRSLGLFGSEPTRTFDKICRLVSTVMNVPMSTICFVDKSDVWVKSSLGFNLSSLPREGSFCNYTIAAEEPLIVPDARVDQRFCDLAYVTGYPQLRFYAGMPIKLTRGLHIGTICAFDTVPHQPRAEQRENLKALAECVESELRLILATRALMKRKSL